MFEDYIQDAYNFYTIAEAKSTSGLEREARMYYRASVFCAASSLEAFVNFIGDTFKDSSSLDKIEVAFLNDKLLEVSTTRATVEEKTKFNSIEGKIKFIIKKFDVPLNLGGSREWSNYLKFKNLRDSLVHPKFLEDEKSIQEYRRRIKC